MDAIDRSVNPIGAFLARLKSAWHGLGEVLPHVTMERILETKGINYKVVMEGLTTDSGKTVPGQYATVRTDTLAPLSVVGEKYNIVQHTDEFKLFDEELSPRGYVYETVGVLNGGAEVFLLANRPANVLEVADGDRLRPYLLLAFNYTGKASMRAKFVAERVVCANTQAIALNERGTKFDHKIRHTASAQERLKDLRETLAEGDAAVARFAQQAVIMVQHQFTTDDAIRAVTAATLAAYGEVPEDSEAVKRYIKATATLSDQIKDNLTMPMQMVGGIEGSRWSLYNAISQWADHEFAIGVKGSARAKAERRFKSIVGGHADDIKIAAWRSLLAA